MPIAVPTLIQRLRNHLMEDPRLDSEEEVNAEINLMSNLELVEVLCFVIEEGKQLEPAASAPR